MKMNRVAGRAWIALVLVAAMMAGLVFFLWEYSTKAEDWVMFPGSPHVYSGGKPAGGMLLDREGALLLDFSGEKTYAPNALQRQAMLHWTGDREGNIRTSMLAAYAREMVGYDAVSGVYHYGNEAGRMKLTLSSDVQIAALKALGEYKDAIGVYNYRTGELICAVSSPSFDPEAVPDIAGDAEGVYDGVYLNRFLQSAYIPGSIFKVVTLAAAVESVPDLLDHRFTCTGSYTIGGGDVTCEGVHGEQSVKDALANSCNCAFAQIVELVGRENMERYVAQFLITEKLSFDGVTTAGGNYDISGASGELVAWSGIGQHTDQINPCAYMTFMGAIAAGGSGVEPYVVQEVSSGGKVTYSASTVRRERIMSAGTAALLQEYMRNNVVAKYGAENFPGLTVCAKSGTGQVGGGKKSNAMMAGFVADEKYPFAFIVAVEDAGYGGAVCPPILSQVLKACKRMVDGG